MTQGETLTLTGSHAATVAVGGNLAASAYTGKLTVTASASGTASQAITTGSGADSITAANGADTITAGAGADTINVSGHTLADTFVYHAVGDSPNTSSGHDTITGFLAGTGTSAINDTLDFSAILGPTYSVQALGSTSTQVNPDSIAWLFNSSANQTLAYVNATGGALSQTSNKLMEVALTGNIHLAAANLIG
jgi:Ca2+-binding RTX toxin-like protein